MCVQYAVVDRLKNEDVLVLDDSGELDKAVCDGLAVQGRPRGVDFGSCWANEMLKRHGCLDDGWQEEF
jgi:hypothetical protein